MVRSILHIGAHRTGTTSLQRFLKDNTAVLEKNGIDFLCPPDSRVGGIPASVADKLKQRSTSPATQMIISDENLLGTMEYNSRSELLYPSAKENLKRIAALYQPDVVMLSIRELGDFWTSSILFCMSRNGVPFPAKENLEAIAAGKRSWLDVVDDIRSVFPDARLVLREFSHLKDNPKRFLKVSTGWQEWNDTKLNRRIQNARPGADEVVSLLLTRRDFQSLSRLGDTLETQIFSPSQRERMYARYQDDLEKLWADHGASLLGGRDHDAPPRASTVQMREEKLVFLHIGKTGGTFLKSLAQSDPERSAHLHLGTHGETLISSIKDFGRHRKLAFFFRNPQDRFISGFASRLRQGRPTYDVNWTTAEAVAFSFFPTPNDLAEALYAKDERLKSAARFSFSAIFHLKHNYGHYLHSADAVRYELQAGNIRACCETGSIDENLDEILKVMGLSAQDAASSNRNAGSQGDADTLSDLGQENLKRFWADEYEIYDACMDAARALGFAK